MSTAYRSDFKGLDFMLESSYGAANATDIVAANYSASGDNYQALTNKKVFGRLVAPPSGMPSFELVPVNHVKQTHQFEYKRVKGLKSAGTLTLQFHLHGAYIASNIPYAAPWMQLLSSMPGFLVAGQAKTAVAATAAVDDFNVDGGTLDAGLVCLVEGPGAAQTNEFFRVTNHVSATSVDAASVPVSATPATSDPFHYPTTFFYDEREDGSQATTVTAAGTKSFCLMLHSSKAESAVIVRGFRVNSIKITDNVGELGMVELTGDFSSWDSKESSSSGAWSGYNGIADTEDNGASLADATNYDSIWPAPEVCKDAEFATGTSSRASTAVSGVEFNLTAGLQKFMANTASEGVSDMLATGEMSCSLAFSALYDKTFRTYLESTGTDAPPLIYQRGSAAGKYVAIHIAQPILLEDPGFEGEVDGNQGQQISYGCGEYTGDSANYAAGTAANHRVSISLA